MSRPHDQRQLLPAAGSLDQESGEFWVENPWFAGINHNLSAFERNRVLLNRGDGTFVEASHLSGGADLDADSRGVVGADLDGDGREDLIVRSAGGGGLRIFANRSPIRGGGSLVVTLKGDAGSGRGIGARLRLRAGGQDFHRQLYPNNSNSAQAPARVHFCWPTGEAESLEVRWPRGEVKIWKKTELSEGRLELGKIP